MSGTDRRKVWFSETLALGLGASLVDWGEPDEDGFYTPALTRPAAPAEGLREAAQAVVDWFADVEGSRLDCLDALRAALKETDREPTGTVARGASPRGLPEHGVSDVPSGSRPPRPPSPPKDREWDGS